jgi:hypothetical protein
MAGKHCVHPLSRARKTPETTPENTGWGGRFGGPGGGPKTPREKGGVRPLLSNVYIGVKNARRTFPKPVESGPKHSWGGTFFGGSSTRTEKNTPYHFLPPDSCFLTLFGGFWDPPRKTGQNHEYPPFPGKKGHFSGFLGVFRHFRPPATRICAKRVTRHPPSAHPRNIIDNQIIYMNQSK